MKTLIIIFLLAQSIILSQDYNGLSEIDFTSQKDSIQTIKKSLLTQKMMLSKSIDSLKSESILFDKKIEDEISGTILLYKKKFGETNGWRIYNKQVWKGMTDKMLMAGWGSPDKRDKNVEKWGVFQQFYYGEVTFFFKDGKLSDWEEKK
jgi:hypothetical protein